MDGVGIEDGGPRCLRCGRVLGGEDPEGRPYLVGRQADAWCRGCLKEVDPAQLARLDQIDQLIRGPEPN